MNDILVFGQHFGAVTDQVESDFHKHWFIQLFISHKTDLEITVENNKIKSQAILINSNTFHQFDANNVIHFTMLINPATQIGRAIKAFILKDKPYDVLTGQHMNKLQSQLTEAINMRDEQNYKALIISIFNCFDHLPFIPFDPRIEEVITRLEDCVDDHNLHQVKDVANILSISESRLSHLFQNNTGMPLKSYIVLHKVFKTYHQILEGKSITEASIAAGFDSSAHFAYTNRKMTGMPARKIIKDSRFLKVML